MTTRSSAISLQPSRRASIVAARPLSWIVRLAAEIVQRRRNAKAAAWLDGQPAYLLDDIGIGRSDVGGIRRRGLPSEQGPSFCPGRR